MDPNADPALRQRFLLGMSHAACTVNVVTTNGSAGRHGVTVSAMVSVSADTPQPTLLVCIHHRSAVAEALLSNGVFCVSVLKDNQSHISEQFAGRRGVHGEAKFECTEWATQVTGAPRVAEALVAFDCRVTASERVGSHFVVFGSVQDIYVAEGGAPLIYANRAYGVPRTFHPRQASRSGSTQTALTVGCYEVFAPYLMPALVARTAKLHPNWALNLVESDQARLNDGLRRGDTELALLYDFGLGAEFSVTPLAQLTPYVLLPEGHPLAECPSVSLRQLAQEPLVLLDLEPSRDYFLSMFEERNLQPLIAHRTRSLEMVRGLVGHGEGYSILATKPANNMSYDGRALVTRPLSDQVKKSQLVLASLARKSLSGPAQEFAAHCRTFFGATHAHANP